MKKILVLLFSITAILQSCEKKTKEIKSSNNELSVLLDEYYQERMKLFPWEATLAGDERYNNIYPNTLSDAYISQVKAFFAKYKESLVKFKDDELSENDRLSKELLAWECDINIEQWSQNEQLMPINQFTSPILTMGQWGSGAGAQPFKTVKDYNNWLERLNDFNIYLTSVEDRMKEGVSKGYVLPKALTIKMIPQLKDMANQDVTSHLLFSPIKQFPDSFSDAEKKELTEKYTTLLKDKIIPSFTNLYNYVSTDYLKASRATSGISAIPNGKEYYNHLIKRYTTTDMTADEIHELGLKEVARISAEMEKVKTEAGFTGPLKDFFNYVRGKKELNAFYRATTGNRQFQCYQRKDEA